jgi:quercetin dioxygenase-like cupin family protein
VRLVRVVADAAATEGRYALLEFAAARGDGQPAHLHRREDEVLLVLSGTLTVVVDGQSITLTGGDVARLPRDVPHRFAVSSDEARFLLGYLPGGFEAALRDAGRWTRDDDDLAALLAARGVEWIPAAW